MLGERESGADRESADGGIDEESDPPLPQHDHDRSRLEEFLDCRRGIARQHVPADADAEKPGVDKQTRNSDETTREDQTDERARAHEFETVEIEKCQQKEDNRSNSEEGHLRSLVERRRRAPSRRRSEYHRACAASS